MNMARRGHRSEPVVETRTDGVMLKFLKEETWAVVHFALLVIYSLCNHVFITYAVPEPYMDEVFHIPQTQDYCQWHYGEWNNKITTLPGLYVFASTIIMVFGYILECSTQNLRAINFIISIGTFWVLLSLIRHKNPKNLAKKRGAFMAYVLTLFPMHYFFTFLFYTDPFSTFLVLLMQLLMEKNEFKWSAICGLYAVFTRQTNIIWVLWTGFLVTWNLVGKDIAKWVKTFRAHYRLSGLKLVLKNAAKYRAGGDAKPPNPVKFSVEFWSDCALKVAPKLMPFALVLTAFAVFVVLNNGIAVGDKAAHQATINLPQMFYFSLFSGVMMSSFILFTLKETAIYVWEHRRSFLAFTILGLLVVHFNTLVHPYLLADNRHYTFYIWKRLYEWYTPVKYLMVPLYFASWFWIWQNVKLDPILRAGLFLCILVNLVPQKLLEFRYFIIPYFLIRLELPVMGWKQLILEFLVYTGFNSFAIYNFISFPFLWESDPDQAQRFMW